MLHTWRLFVERLESLDLLSTGALDAVFGNAGKVLSDFQAGADQANALVVQPDRKVIVAGQTTGANTRTALARYTTLGALDPTFGQGRPG